MVEQSWTAHLEAIFFANAEPVSVARLADILDISPQEVHQAIDELKAALEQPKRGIMLVEVAGGFQLCTKPYYFPWIEKLNTAQEPRFSNAAMECLAIVAMKQPVTKQEIEQLRGVNSDRVVASLLEKGLLDEAGRKEVVGRPILYVTTPEFLKCFGLRSLEEFSRISSNGGTRETSAGEAGTVNDCCSLFE